MNVVHLLLRAATVGTAFTARSRHAPQLRRRATSTSEMVDVASSILETPATLKIGPVSFTRVRDDDDEAGEPLLYVPGIEFRGISIAAQLPALVDGGYDPWYCWVDGTDASPFEDVVGAVTEFSRQRLANKGLLVGESLGGLVATAAAIELSDSRDLQTLRGVALVNPATSYDRTPWDLGGRAVSAAPPGPAYAASIAAAVGLFASDNAMIGKAVGEFSQLDLSGLQRAFAGADRLGDLVPPATLRHRVVDWLDRGCAATNEKLWRLRRTGRAAPFTVLAGADDRFLPSRSEAARLEKAIGAEPVILPRGGHALLVDPERLNLATALRASRALYGEELRKKALDKAQRAVADFVPPNATTIADARKSVVDPLRRLVSPVFFSTAADGGVVRGLGEVPTPGEGRPVLLVGNHQLFGADLSLLVDEFLREKDVLIRGLAHPVATNAPSLNGRSGAGGPRAQPEWWDGGPRRRDGFGGGGTGDTFFQTFGAVEVTPRNFVRLLKDDECILLFPGGVRESNHDKGEDYQLFWPEETDFVRAAAKFGADIVPFGAIGAASSVTFLRDKADSPQPDVPAARRWANREEDFRFPVAIPTSPRRFYFRFGAPLSTADLDPADRAACAEVYATAKADVEASIAYLLAKRDEDAFEDPAARLPWEALGGGRAQAPTFTV